MNRWLPVTVFQGLDLEVHRVALVPDQVREYGLPSTPLKATEKLADAWSEAMRVEQTEIDALAALQPDLLAGLARDAIAPFYDTTLERRAQQLRAEWRDAAQQAIDDQAGGEQMEQLRTDTAARLEELRARIDEVLDEVHIDVDQFDLPEVPALPEPELTGDAPEPLLDSRWDFAEQCRRLIASKNYEWRG